jgi:hypothetical protein
MKTSTIGIVSVAVLMVVAGVGFGIAQAAGTHSEQPVLSFEDQEATQVATSAADDIQLSSAGQEFVPEDNWSGTDWQARGPVETGAIQVTVFEDSWMKDYGND